jgi:hypothetical protein
LSAQHADLRPAKQHGKRVIREFANDPEGYWKRANAIARELATLGGVTVVRGLARLLKVNNPDKFKDRQTITLDRKDWDGDISRLSPVQVDALLAKALETGEVVETRKAMSRAWSSAWTSRWCSGHFHASG